MRKFSFGSLFGCVLLCVSILLTPALAVEKFKVSSNGAGQQIWFEAEDFDERSKNENYQLGKKEKAVKHLVILLPMQVVKVGYCISLILVGLEAKQANGV